MTNPEAATHTGKARDHVVTTSVAVRESIRVKPFLKWAGGKSRLLPTFRGYFPWGLVDGTIRRYVEPFLGGGAVFFEVAQRYRVEDALLCDVNEELILCYKVVQRDPEALAHRLEEYRQRYMLTDEPARSTMFYSVREAFNRRKHQIDFDTYSLDWIERAACLIFLNKTCFNGLFRVNAAGLFNVPFGRYGNPDLHDRGNLLRASALLQRAELRRASYEAVRPTIARDTFVYFDPPYRPVSRSASFTSYSRTGFTDGDQLRLAAFFKQLDSETGAMLMLSNSDPTHLSPQDDFFDRAYAHMHIHRVEAARAINSVGSGRGKVPELIITNYEVPRL